MKADGYWGTGTSPYDIIEPEPTLDEETGKLTLPASHIAAKAAFDYGAKIGGTGRLMRYSEANALVTEYGDIIYGRESSVEGYFSYWLGSASCDYGMWYVSRYGNSSGSLAGNSYTNRIDYYKVRPVVEISKTVL